MMKVLKGGLLGGLIIFIWSALSWMVLPWHMATLHTFKNEAAVSKVILDNAPRSGMYMMPMQENATTQGQPQAPMIFAAVHKSDMISMTQAMIVEVVTQIVCAILVTLLLYKTKGLSYGGRVWFMFLFGLVSSIGANMPYWIWFHFSTGFTLVAMADVLIAWTLAGLVIAKVVGDDRSS